ncbi:hypothetical protein Syun_019167 [Stephania yunnanensis]|uniref:SUPPRESSOR OF ABI3-5 n=1 Tax=Stephania yunnanensis TaxID=152371 RepID=A0AAP0IUA6_9MAGN
MDPGRYVLQHGWDNNSALEGYGAVHEPDFRVGGSYSGRRYFDEGVSRGNIYTRGAFHQELLDRDTYPPPSTVSAWGQPRRRGPDVDYALTRESRRHEKPYVDAFHDMDGFRGGEKYRDADNFQEGDKFRDDYHTTDSYRDVDAYNSHGFDRSTRLGGRDRNEFSVDEYDYRHRLSHQNRESSREKDYDYGRSSYDSDYDKGSRRDGGWRRRDSRDRDRDKRDLSRERDQTSHRRHERSSSYGHEDRVRSRSPRGRSHGRSHREDSYDDGRYDRDDKRRDHDEKRSQEYSSVAPSATVLVKGLSQKTTEEDLYQVLTEWGPLRHVRVIKERNSGISRGFAFIDFPSVAAARSLIDRVGEEGLVFDGRKLLFEYSSKPTGGPPYGQENFLKSSHGGSRSNGPPSDWMCTICGCVNFARRTSCFQCNEARSDDAPAADVTSSNPVPSGKKGLEAGPSHVLVVRGLDENADEEMLRYDFSKHAPLKDLRLVRDKFTHVSRGFAFVHFHSVEDATRALEATNGTTLERNGQILRVAYAKSIHGPSSGASGSSHSSSLAAAAIEAATFAQQYDAVGWAPKEYNPDEKQSGSGQQGSGNVNDQKNSSALQSGFVWDEASGYYYDAASGFYYDGNTGLYYDSNNGTWYSYNQQTQQYVPCADQNADKTSGKPTSEASKTSDGSSNRKVVISAPAMTNSSNDKSASLPDAVQAAAAAALAAEKKEKEKAKEIKLASKNSLLASKKKMNNVLNMWKQRNHEGQAARVVLEDNTSTSIDDKMNNVGSTAKNKYKIEVTAKDNTVVSPVYTSTAAGVMGVIRSSGRGVVKSDTVYAPSSSGASASAVYPSSSGTFSANQEAAATANPFKIDPSALGTYTPPVAAGSGKRRFSEMPMNQVSAQREQPQTAYRDRAAERRSLYGSSSSIGDNMPELGLGDSNRDPEFKKGSLSDAGVMPFPPGVGGRGASEGNSVQSYEVITADKAIDESNVGNRLLRSMGWQEGLGLGKDGSGITEPVQAQAMDARAGLGSQQRKVDPSLEAHAGDTYKTIIQKKALARFREMS